MVSEDILGYPPKVYFQRMWLERAWKAIFGALDIGARDFYGNCEEFLKGNEDLTYKAAKNLLISKATGEFVSELKSLSNEEDQLIDAEREYLFEELGKHEGIGEHARSYIERKEGENRVLKEEIAQLRKHPKRKPSEKRKTTPLDKFKVKGVEVKAIGARKASPAPQTPSTEYIKELCKQSPLRREEMDHLVRGVKLPDIDIALSVVRECKTLDDFDKYEIEELLKDKAMGITERKEPKQIHKHIIPGKFGEKGVPPKISTGKTRREERGEYEGEGEEEEQVPDEVHGYNIVRPKIDVKRLNFGEAHDFLLAYNKYLPEILRVGLRAWFTKHPQAQKFPLHQANYDQLFHVLSMYISPYPPNNIKEFIGYKIIQDSIGVAIEFGMALALSQIEWETYYNQARERSKQLPEMQTFKKDIMETLTKIMQELRVA